MAIPDTKREHPESPGAIAAPQNRDATVRERAEERRGWARIRAQVKKRLLLPFLPAADQCRGFGGLSNRFLITTQGGGDSEYLRWGYNTHATYKTTGYCKIEQANFGFFEPLEPVEANKPSG